MLQKLKCLLCRLLIALKLKEACVACPLKSKKVVSIKSAKKASAKKKK